MIGAHLFHIKKKCFHYLDFLKNPIRHELIKNTALHNIGVGKCAFVCATGPSIKQENLQLLAGQDCFSVSNFFLHKDIEYISPRLHFFAPYHKPLILENYVAWLRQADEHLPKETNIVLGHTTYELVKQNNLFPQRTIFYVYLDQFHDMNKKIDLTTRILTPQTGPLMIIPFLIYMGYSRIYLLGCDHTVLRDFKKPINHFFDKELDARINASDKHAWANIITELECNKNVFLCYLFYKKICTSKGITIINLSKDSWLDMFPFDSLENVINKEPNDLAKKTTHQIPIN